MPFKKDTHSVTNSNAMTQPMKEQELKEMVNELFRIMNECQKQGYERDDRYGEGRAFCPLRTMAELKQQISLLYAKAEAWDKLKKAEEEKFTSEIIAEIVRAIELLGGSSDIIGTINSWNDTLDDHDVWRLLQEWNKVTSLESTQTETKTENK